MPGDVGLVAKLVDSLLHFFTDEDQLKETLKRMAITKKQKECHRALEEKRFVDLARLTAELERLCNQA
jgi:hypothetical protein